MVPRLCGVFDATFWGRLVLQASQHEPAIRHAVIALSSLHENFETSDLSKESLGRDTFALQHYVKAIECLVQPQHGQSKHTADVALMACVLFICFEVSRRLFNKSRRLT